MNVLDVWPYAVVAAPGLFAVYRTYTASRLVREKEHASLVKIAQEAAKAVIGDLRSEIARLQRQVEALEAELTGARKDHAETVAAKDAELALKRGEIRHLQAIVEAYERLLTANDIPHEKPAQPYWLIPSADHPEVEAG